MNSKTSYNLRPRKKQRETTDNSTRRLDVLALIRTNHVTAPQERPIIQASIKKHREDVKKIDSKIEDLYGSIYHLQQRRSAVKGIIEGHKNLLRPSPVRTLPAEILGEIFAAYCDMHTPHDFFASPRSYCDLSRVKRFRRSRMTLLHVCQRWRRTALSSPRLWKAFHFIGEGPLNVNLSQQWLDASASVPLDLIYNVDDLEDHNVDNLQLLCAKMPQCGRLQLQFNGHFCSASRAVLRQLDCAPQLTKLAFMAGARIWNTRFMREWTGVFLRNTPLLSSLMTNAPPDMLLPLSQQVTYLHLPDRSSSFDILMYLKNLKGLESLRVDLLQKIEPGTGVHSTMVESNVQSWVSRMEYRGSSYETLFDNLTLPRLRCLDIDFGLCPTESLRAMFKRSACQLEALSLRPRWAPAYKRDADVVQRLLEFLKLEQVDQYLQRFLLLIRDDDSSETRNIIPNSVLEMLSAQTRTLSKLVDVRFTVSSEQAHLVQQFLENRVIRCESQGVVKLDFLGLHILEDDYRPSWKQAKDDFPFLNSYRQEGANICVVVHKDDPFQYLSGAVSDSD